MAERRTELLHEGSLVVLSRLCSSSEGWGEEGMALTGSVCILVDCRDGIGRKDEQWGRRRKRAK